MRFCMVTTFYPPYHYGGDATFVRALSRALAGAGHHVEVVHCVDAFRAVGGTARAAAADEAACASAGDREPGVVVHRLRTALGMLSPLFTQQTGRAGPKAGQLRALLERDFDVVNFHNVSLVGGPQVLTMSRAPVTLYTLHEHWLLCPTHVLWKDRSRSCDRPTCVRCCVRSGIPPQLWRYTNLVARSLGSVDLLLSPSRFTAERHRAAGIAAPIRVLPTFSGLEPPPEPSAVVGRPRFVYVGRVTASKGVGDLVAEAASLPEADLEIVGDGDLRGELERRCRALPHVRFLGPRPQAALAEVYRGATALVVPSLAPEVFPLSVIEAFACGTPAIVHDAGGSREAVDATGAGIVYATRGELGRAMRALVRDPARRARLGARARAGYEARYTREVYLREYLAIVAELTAEKAGRVAVA